MENPDALITFLLFFSIFLHSLHLSMSCFLPPLFNSPPLALILPPSLSYPHILLLPSSWTSSPPFPPLFFRRSSPALYGLIASYIKGSHLHNYLMLCITHACDTPLAQITGWSTLRLACDLSEVMPEKEINVKLFDSLFQIWSKIVPPLYCRLEQIMQNEMCTACTHTLLLYGTTPCPDYYYYIEHENTCKMENL